MATPANLVRAIDAVTAKPETTETLTGSTVALKQLASVVSLRAFTDATHRDREAVLHILGVGWERRRLAL